ncbi:hypothetical protein D3OALGA1CA_5100 [Olavius algarvensis associated proteobacterium Delta 3]|nr:hypothetical protein D3OALGA1CA_5100 [Olavius algarvensis associated proteobacterium Delta 3]
MSDVRGQMSEIRGLPAFGVGGQVSHRARPPSLSELRRAKQRSQRMMIGTERNR